jgi:tetratricopeptide (TPR) repeat protein
MKLQAALLAGLIPVFLANTALAANNITPTSSVKAPSNQQQKATKQVTSAQAVSMIAKLPEIIAWQQYIKDQSAGKTRAVLRVTSQTLQKVNGKDYWSISFYESQNTQDHRWQSFLVRSDGKEILADDINGNYLDLPTWRQKTNPMNRTLGLQSQRSDQSQTAPPAAQTTTTEEVNRLNQQSVKLYQQGNYPEAASFAERALRLAEENLGKDHPAVASSLNNLSELYRVQKEYGKAETLLLRAIRIDETVLGASHPDLASSLNNLAVIYQAQGKYDRAEPILQRVLTILETKLGKDDRLVGYTLQNLAGVYSSQNQPNQAEPLFQRALGILETKLGKNDPMLIHSLQSLAVLYSNQQQYDKAEPLYLRTLGIYENTLGTNHPNAIATIENLAQMYKNTGNIDKAKHFSQRAIELRKQGKSPAR